MVFTRDGESSVGSHDSDEEDWYGRPIHEQSEREPLERNPDPLGSCVELAPATDDDSQRDEFNTRCNKANLMSKPSRAEREAAWSIVDFGPDDIDVLLAVEKSPSKWKKSAAALKSFLASLISLPRGITVDSGAADSVFPARWLRRSLLGVSPGSLAKQFYIAASGTKLMNLGQFMMSFYTKDGVKAEVLFQIADINKPLCSVSHLTDLGYCVVFNRHNNKDVSYIMHKETKQFWRMRRERGVFVLDSFLTERIDPRDASEKILPPKSPDAGFIRQG